MEGVNGVVWLRIGTGGGFTGMSLRVPWKTNFLTSWAYYQLMKDSAPLVKY
jgi:hypothetical protein